MATHPKTSRPVAQDPFPSRAAPRGPLSDSFLGELERLGLDASALTRFAAPVPVEKRRPWEHLTDLVGRLAFLIVERRSPIATGKSPSVRTGGHTALRTDSIEHGEIAVLDRAVRDLDTHDNRRVFFRHLIASRARRSPDELAWYVEVLQYASQRAWPQWTADCFPFFLAVESASGDRIRAVIHRHALAAAPPDSVSVREVLWSGDFVDCLLPVEVAHRVQSLAAELSRELDDNPFLSDGSVLGILSKVLYDRSRELRLTSDSDANRFERASQSVYAHDDFPLSGLGSS